MILANLTLLLLTFLPLFPGLNCHQWLTRQEAPGAPGKVPECRQLNRGPESRRLFAPGVQVIIHKPQEMLISAGHLQRIGHNPAVAAGSGYNHLFPGRYLIPDQLYPNPAASGQPPGFSGESSSPKGMSNGRCTRGPAQFFPASSKDCVHSPGPSRSVPVSSAAFAFVGSRNAAPGGAGVGRGPSRLMSPFKTLNNWGSSSRLKLRSPLPHPGNPCLVVAGKRAGNAGPVLVRDHGPEFKNRNCRPSLPVLHWLKENGKTAVENHGQ